MSWFDDGANVHQDECELKGPPLRGGHSRRLDPLLLRPTLPSCHRHSAVRQLKGSKRHWIVQQRQTARDPIGSEFSAVQEKIRDLFLSALLWREPFLILKPFTVLIHQTGKNCAN